MRRILIEDVMTKAPVCVDEEVFVPEASGILRKRGVRQLPVIREGRLVGAVSRLDLEFAHQFRFVNELKVGHIMDEAALVVRPGRALQEVLDEMHRNKKEFAVVADEDGRIAGIFTRQDALKLLLEHRPRKAKVVRLGSRPLRVLNAA